jgi:hypothetical protein
MESKQDQACRDSEANHEHVQGSNPTKNQLLLCGLADDGPGVRCPHPFQREEYRALGVAEYWVIDRFRRTMTVYRNPPREPAEQVVAEHETYRTDLLPGFELPLARLMAAADRWPAKRKKRPK